MDEIYNRLEAALEDNILSKSEAASLRDGLKKKNPSFDEVNRTRARLFRIVAEKQNPRNFQELHRFLEDAVRVLMRQLKPKRIEHITECHFSPGDGCRDAIVSRLDGAKRHIRICVFTISDDRISRAIVAAHRRGVAIEIITDNDKMADAGSDIALFRKVGIAVYIDRTDYHMHHKFSVIDDHWLLSGSFNWTRSASEHNQENLLVTDNADAVARYDQEFTRLLPLMVRLG